MPLKNAYFRQVLASATTSWSNADGKHPVLAVALSPVVIELNSGQTQKFQAGEIILLEDHVLLVGHRMRSVGGGDLKLLFLTLPQQHYHPGKDNVSIKVGMKSKDPCPDTGYPIQTELQQGGSSKSSSRTAAFIAKSNGWNGRRIRLAILATLGLSISTFFADFLGKTAPLWLAVGVGGTCFVAGGTCALAIAGDKLLTAIELWQERRRLGVSSRTEQSDDSSSEVLSANKN